MVSGWDLKWQVLDMWWGAPWVKSLHFTAAAGFPNADKLVRTRSLLLTWRASLCGHILSPWFCDEQHGPWINKPQMEELLPPVENSGFLFSLSPTSSSTEHINIQTLWRPRPNTKSKNHRQNGVYDCQVRCLETGWDQSRGSRWATVPGVAKSKTRLSAHT